MFCIVGSVGFRSVVFCRNEKEWGEQGRWRRVAGGKWSREEVIGWPDAVGFAGGCGSSGVSGGSGV
jgi:hypothetical protein